MSFDLETLTAPLREFLTRQRWASRARRIAGLRFEDTALLPYAGERYLLTFVRVDYAEGPPERLFLPLAPLDAADHRPSDVVARFQTRDGETVIGDAFATNGFPRALLLAMASGRDLPTSAGGALRFRSAEGSANGLALTAVAAEVRRVSTEQSNSSIVYGADLILKAFRKVAEGLNPDLEIPRFLSQRLPDGRSRFEHVPAVAGWIEWAPAASPNVSASVAVLQAFVPNAGDGWSHTLDSLREAFRTAAAAPRLFAAREQLAPLLSPYLRDVRRLGEITAALHLALASDPEAPDFRPEPTTWDDVAAWRAVMREQSRHVLAALAAGAADRYPPAVRGLIRRIEARPEALLGKAETLSALAAGRVAKIRYHGDYHLGQVLKTADGFIILDFEGEPLRSLAARRAKGPPLKDVAGMLRSFNYARHTIVREVEAGDPEAAERLDPFWRGWEESVRAAFLGGYFETARPGAAPFLPAERNVAHGLTVLFELEKAVYEVNYELNHRPDWLPIPLSYVAHAVELGDAAHGRSLG